MQVDTSHFKEDAKAAINNKPLQEALDKLSNGFVAKRAKAIKNFPQFDELRDYCVQMKNHTISQLDTYLEQFEKNVITNGGHVHWAKDGDEACAIALRICQQQNAKLVTKSKSMLTEEIGLNAMLEKSGLEVVETDLGEYIIQLRKETPSHIVVPAMHLLKDQVADTFHQQHSELDEERDLSTPEAMLNEARHQLRKKFPTADIGITGANFLIAQTGTGIIVTNEGNANLTQNLAKTHLVFAGIDKVVPTFDDAAKVLRLLARSATGQDTTSYVTCYTGPRHDEDLDGPQEFHIILVDNGRSNMLGSEFQDMLRCIRCGACLNHCPVYHSIGGQAYGSMYTGPMGAVITPSIFGIKNSKALPNASTFCGKCEEVCPMRIPLPSMMRGYREQEFTQHLNSFQSRFGIKAWAFLAKRPTLYSFVTSTAIRFLKALGGKKKYFKKLPLASGWTQYRDFPAPEGKSFQAQWKERHHD
jgi:L-lactate dehydrogenase complex protein LldF